MIRYLYDGSDTPELGGTYYPVIICDACGDPISKSGNTYWLMLPDGSLYPQVWHTHKHPCSRLDDVIKAHIGGPESIVMSEELGRWLDQLAHTFTRPPDAVRKATFHAS